MRATPGVQLFDRLAGWGRGGPFVLEATQVAAALAALQAALAEALRAADFALERRAFRPHVTLVRQPVRRAAPVPAAVAWPFHDFVLVESRAGPARSQYTIVASFPPP